MVIMRSRGRRAAVPADESRSVNRGPAASGRILKDNNNRGIVTPRVHSQLGRILKELRRHARQAERGASGGGLFVLKVVSTRFFTATGTAGYLVLDCGFKPSNLGVTAFDTRFRIRSGGRYRPTPRSPVSPTTPPGESERGPIYWPIAIRKRSAVVRHRRMRPWRRDTWPQSRILTPSASRFGGTIGGSRRSECSAICSRGHQMPMTMPPVVSGTHDEAAGS